MYLNFYRCSECSSLIIITAPSSEYKISVNVSCVSCGTHTNNNFVQHLICNEKQAKALRKYYESINIPII